MQATQTSDHSSQLLSIKKGMSEEFWNIFTMQVYFTFVQSLPLLFILGPATGVAITFQAKIGLSMMGQNDQLGRILVFILFREVAPLATILIVIARSVTAVASELATMKVQREVDALEIMGIDSKKYLWTPRIAAGVASQLCMSVTFWCVALFGSWMAANISSYVPLMQFLSDVAEAFKPADLIFFLLKSTITGGLVFTIACIRGFSLKKAPYEVPIVTNQAVVDALFTAIGMQIFLSVVFYLIYGLQLGIGL